MARKTQGIGCITKEERKNGTYYRAHITAGLKEDGTPYRLTKASYDKQEVIDWLKEYNNKVLTPNSLRTLSEMTHKWLEIKESTVSTKSYEKYETKVRLYLDPDPISDIIISEITIDQLQYYINKIEKQYGNSIANQLLIIIRSVFNRMHDLGELDTNYSKFIKLKTTNKTVGERKKKPLNKKQRIKLLEELDLNDKTDLAIYISFFSGLRLGEVMALTDKDIGITEINVDKSWTRIEKAIFGLKPPKNESSIRTVPIPINAMKNIKKYTQNAKGYIISDTGTKPITVNKIQRRMDKISKIINTKISFHGLRHTYATTLFEQGIDPKVVQTLLGHESLATTMQVYVEVTNETKQHSVQTLNHLAL